MDSIFEFYFLLENLRKTKDQSEVTGCYWDVVGGGIYVFVCFITALILTAELLYIGQCGYIDFG